MAINTFITKTKILVLAGVILTYTLVGFFLLPILAKKTVTEQLSIALDRQVEIEKVSINPYTLSAAVHGLRIIDKNEDKNDQILFAADRLYGNVSLLSIFTFTAIVSDIQVESPLVNIIRNEDNSFNFSDLLVKSPEKQSPQEDKPIFRFVLKKAGITQGKIHLLDKTNGTAHVLDNLSVSLLNLSSKHENRFEKTRVDVGCNFNQAPVEMVIESMPFTPELATQVNMDVQDMDLLHYLAYLEVPETLLVNDIDFNCTLQADYKKSDQKNQLLVKGLTRLSNIDIATFENQPVLKASQLAVQMASSDLLNAKINVSTLELDGLDLAVLRDKTGQFDFLNHLPETPETVETAQPPETGDHPAKKDPQLNLPFVLNVNELQVNGAHILFEDLSNAQAFQTRISPLNLKLSNLAVNETISGDFSLDLESDQKETLSSQGSFGLFPLETKGVLDVSGLAAARYAPYFNEMVNFRVKNANLDLSCDFDVSQKEEAFSVLANNKAFVMKNLVITDTDLKQEWANIPQLSIEGSVLDLENKTVETGTIASGNGKILIDRYKNGQINFIAQTQTENNTKGTAGISPKADASDQTTFSGWKVNLNKLDFSDYSISFKDAINTDPVDFELLKINVKVDQLKTFGKEKGKVSAQMVTKKRGFIRANGQANLADMSAGLNLDIGKIDIQSLQPYFTDKIKILVTKGDIHTKGKLELNLMQKQNQVRFRGKSSITDFICLDKETSNDFLKYNSLYLSEMDLSTMPLAVNIKDISLTDFYSRIIVSDTGTINISTLLEEKPQSQEDESADHKPEPQEPTVPEITIANVTLQGGDISFSDYLTRPNFTANMKQIAGSVTGLSSDQQSRAKLILQGLHGQSSPLEITGDINPLAARKFFDVKISYKDIDLVNFTPYSSKYLGYKIEKGKLILDLEYTVDGPSLKSENRARFVNFDLGESVESEHATALPVALAVSLLKDSDGQINLDLPVTGELDDPEFSMGSVILDMLGNLIVKVATSPFAIIGAMFGGGEELAYVDFEFGHTDFDAQDNEKLEKLIEILVKKPEISLEIQGGYDPDRDAHALREKGFVDLIKSEKLKQLMKKGKASGSLSQITLTQEEEKLYTQIAYAKATFPKPRDSKGAEKEVTTQEKKTLLMSNVKVTNDDLRLLAMNRSKQIKAYILDSGKVDKQRIYLVEPKPSDPELKLDTSRVNFLLK